MLPFISALPDQVATALLVVLIIAGLIVAFKVLEMVFETILVTVVSGVFYVALSFVLGYNIDLNGMLTYAFIGSTLYMVYSLLASAYSVIGKVFEIPIKLFKIGLVPLKSIFRDLKEKHRLKKYQRERKDEEREKKDEKTDNNTKEVVLDKVTKEKDKDA